MPTSLVSPCLASRRRAVRVFDVGGANTFGSETDEVWLLGGVDDRVLLWGLLFPSCWSLFHNEVCRTLNPEDCEGGSQKFHDEKKLQSDNEKGLSLRFDRLDIPSNHLIVRPNLPVCAFKHFVISKSVFDNFVIKVQVNMQTSFGVNERGFLLLNVNRLVDALRLV